MAVRARDHRASLFKYTTADTAIKILQSGSVRYSSPLCFNDIFDVQTGLDLPFNAADLPSRVMDRLESIVATGREIPPLWTDIAEEVRRRQAAGTYLRAELQDLMRPGLEVMGALMDRYKREVLAHWEEQLPRMRVFCLTDAYDNLRMWAQYAGNFSGVVIEFAVLPEIDNELCAAQPVVYKETAPLLFTEEQWMDLVFAGAELGADELFREYPLTKSVIWEEEREWRVHYTLLTPQTSLYSFHPLRANEIRAIYLGPSIAEESKKTVSGLLVDKFPDAQIYHARKSGRDFRLEFEAG